MRPWVSGDHRRMMKKEEKAKVVAAVLGGAEWINFFAALATLHHGRFEEEDELH